MSGGNGIPKFARWNREEEFEDLKYRGIAFQIAEINLETTSPNPNLNPDDILRNLIVGTPATSPFTMPLAASVIRSSQFHNIFGNEMFPIRPGNQINDQPIEWTQTISNGTGAPLTIRYPVPDWTVTANTGLVPAGGFVSIVIPTQGVVQVTYRAFSATNAPPNTTAGIAIIKVSS